jgi:hypothetical protein
MKHPDTGEHVLSKPCRPHGGHPHRHQQSCGHKAVKHGDHVDYEHDGHIHRVHGDHVDECEGAESTN